jgi:hypothetical protein
MIRSPSSEKLQEFRSCRSYRIQNLNALSVPSWKSIAGDWPLCFHWQLTTDTGNFLYYFVSKGHAVLGAGFGYLDRGGFAGSFGGVA